MESPVGENRELRLGWPNTTEANFPVVIGGSKISVRLFWSETTTLLAPSTFTSKGWQIDPPSIAVPPPPGGGPQSFRLIIAKLLLPNTADAFSPLEKGGGKIMIRELPESATYRLSDVSTERPEGMFRVDWLGGSCLLLTRFGCPITKVAGIPMVNGGLNISTRELFTSLTKRVPSESNASPLGEHIPTGVGGVSTHPELVKFG